MTLKIPPTDAHIDEATAHLIGILNAFRSRGFIIDGCDGTISIHRVGELVGADYIYIQPDDRGVWARERT
jgi:hypothetical protein